MAARKRSSAKRRRRDKHGHFMKAKARSNSRKRTAKKTRRSSSRRTSRRRVAPKRRSRMKKVSKRLARRTNGKFATRRRHRVRGHLAKKPGSRKRVRVRAHYSYEEMPKENPRRRRRRRARNVQEVMEMPKRRRRRSAKKSTAPRRRRRRHAAEAAANPRKRRRARKNPTVVLRRRRRAGRGKKKTQAIRVHINLAGRRRSAGKRRGSRRSRKTTYRRGKKRRRTPTSRRLGPGRGNDSAFHMAGPMENPLGYGLSGYSFENPLSSGELALAFVAGGAGFVGGELLDRYLAISGAPTNVPGPVAVQTAPGIKRILAQAGAAAATLVASHFVRQPLGKASLQGMTLGIGVGLAGKLIMHAAAKFFGVNTDGTVKDNWFGTAMSNELVADKTTGSWAATGTAGLPTGVGRPPVTRSLPYGIAGRRAAVGAGVGAADQPTPPMTPPQNYIPTQTPVGGAIDGQPCLPCTADTAAQAVNAAFNASQDDVRANGLGAAPNGAQHAKGVGIGFFNMFPED